MEIMGARGCRTVFCCIHCATGKIRLYGRTLAKKTEIVTVRLDEEMHARMLEAVDVSGIPPAFLIRACVEALIEYLEREGEITLPLAVIPKKKLEALEKLAGE